MAEPYGMDLMLGAPPEGEMPAQFSEQPQVDVSAYQPPPEVSAAKQKLLDLYEKDNIAVDLDEEQLRLIGQRVVDDYEHDEESRKEWINRNKEAIALANQVREDKTWPWSGAANVKLPLIADASIKFAARAYSEIIRDGQVVKGKVVGPDPNQEKDQRAQRVGQYMSWQLTEGMDEWEEDTDRLLHILPVVGHLFRKTYYSQARKRCYTELVLPDKLCINNAASSLEDARRLTHILDSTHKNTVIENQRSGVWLDVELKSDEAEGEPEDEEYFNFLEQHRWLDLDDDDYEEPYIVTVHKESKKVVRIVARFEPDDILETPAGEIARIDPCAYFSDYKFIPSFDGSFYYTGFGALLCPLNESANTLFNQLMDAGTIANLGGGLLSKDIKIKGGIYRFSPNEWKKTEATAEQLKNGVMPMPVRDPSPTLFNLLGLVMDLTKDLASVKDVLAGDTPGNTNMQPTTVLALIEQGMKTFNAIYKRLYRSLRAEFKILYRLNYRYLDEEEYFNVMDEHSVAFREDFERESLDLVPVADPYLSSDMQRLSRAQAMKEYIGMPGINPRPILKYSLEAMRTPPELIAEILPEEDPNASPPLEVLELEQKAQFKQADAELKEQELSLREREFDLKASAQEAQIVQILSQAVKNFADAEAAEAGLQMQSYQNEVNNLLEGVRAQQSERQQMLAERKQQADERAAQQAAKAPQP